MKILSKKRKFIILSSLLVIILIVTVVVVASMRNKVLGEADIIVYAKGKRMVLDSKSPYFRKLQKACEEMLTSAESLPEIKKEDLLRPEEIKNKEWAIELIYDNPVKVNIFVDVFPEQGPPTSVPIPVQISSFLIPLTGELTQIKTWGVTLFRGSSGAAKKIYTILFPSKQIFINQKNLTIGSKKQVSKIKHLLTHKFNIPIPD